MSDIAYLTADNYDEEIKEGIVVIDFYADWCGPCKMMAPIFEETAKEYDGKAEFRKINIDEQQQLAVQNKVMSIPTLVFFKDGTAVDRVVGVIDKPTFAEKLNALV